MAVTFTFANIADVALPAIPLTIITTGTTFTATTPGGYLINTAAGGFSFILPFSTQISVGQCVSVKNITGNNAITVTPPSGQIEGSSFFTMAGGSRTHNIFLWDGTNWWVIA